MNCTEIIKEYLQQNRFDGLVNTDMECGCTTEDFAPCHESNFSDCEPAYKHKANCRQCDTKCDGYSEEKDHVCFSTIRPFDFDGLELPLQG